MLQWNFSPLFNISLSSCRDFVDCISAMLSNISSLFIRHRVDDVFIDVIDVSLMTSVEAANSQTQLATTVENCTCHSTHNVTGLFHAVDIRLKVCYYCDIIMLLLLLS